MDIDKFHYLRSKLISEKMKALKTLNNMDNYLNELSNYGNHPGDLGTETFMREQDEGFKNQLKELLFEIEDSLEDMKDGKYGLCKNCDAEIPTARLEILPSFSTGDYMGIARDEDLESMDDVENISQEYYDSTLK